MKPKKKLTVDSLKDFRHALKKWLPLISSLGFKEYEQDIRKILNKLFVQNNYLMSFEKYME